MASRVNPGDLPIYVADADWLGPWLLALVGNCGHRISEIAGEFIETGFTSSERLEAAVERLATWPYDFAPDEVPLNVYPRMHGPGLWADIKLRAGEMIAAFCLVRLAGTQFVKDDAAESQRLQSEADQMERAFNTWYAARRIVMRLEAGVISATEAEAEWRTLSTWEHFFVHPSLSYTYLSC